VLGRLESKQLSIRCSIFFLELTFWIFSKISGRPDIIIYNVTSDISVLSYLLTIRLSCTPARPPFHYKGECITQRAGWVQLITTFFACRTINSISHGRARSQTNCYLCWCQRGQSKRVRSSLPLLPFWWKNFLTFLMTVLCSDGDKKSRKWLKEKS